MLEVILLLQECTMGLASPRRVCIVDLGKTAGGTSAPPNPEAIQSREQKETTALVGKWNR
jgi:hypothetical protein